MIGQALGGIGLFLIGMVLTTDGLRAAAGDALRRVLLRFTGGPLKALLTGAAVTALVQSSSATTMATIGFVGAGLITFHQSLGIIFGANLGTTATGWIVAGLGLKFSMSYVAMPMVGVGALVRLFAKGRAQHLGLALAGFGMIFVGIDVLQAGMIGLSSWLTPSALPSDTLLGRLALVGLGALLTAVMQSSSAAMATVLTALHAGGVSLPQAAAMVIGVNVGTTITAGIAATGASVAAKRTALAHLLFNAVTGAVAFSLLPLFVWLSMWLLEEAEGRDPTLVLSAFHTVFNLVGILLLLPFARRFAVLIERLVKERGSPLTRNLDPNAAQLGALAVEAVRSTAQEIASVVFSALQYLLRNEKPPSRAVEQLEAATHALGETQRYMTQLRVMEQLSPAEQERHLSTIHALDHLDQLIERAMELSHRRLVQTHAAPDLVREISASLDALLAWCRDPQEHAPTGALRQTATRVQEGRAARRAELLRELARGGFSPAQADAELDALRCFDEISHALYRLTDHLSGERILEPTPRAPEVLSQ